MKKKTEILRIVVRESMNADLIERVTLDILSITEQLMATNSSTFQMCLASSIKSKDEAEAEILGQKQRQEEGDGDLQKRPQTYSRTC